MNIKSGFPFKFYFRILILACGLLSCNSGNVYEKYQKFDKHSWNRFDILQFDVPIDDIESAFDIILLIRHLPEFPLTELPVNMTIYTPSGEMRSAEHLLKFVTKEGKKLSKCLGDYCDIPFVLREGITFQETGIIRIEIENKHPRTELPAILEVGLKLEKRK